MKKLEKIFIPVDYSETSLTALDFGVKLASTLNAKVQVFHVKETESLLFANPEFEAYHNLLENKIADRVKELENLYKIDIHFLIKTGKPVYKEIVYWAEEYKTDLIIMGTYGATGIQEYLAGSNAYKVLSASKSPVLTLHPNNSEFPKNILCPISSDPNTRQKLDEVAYLAQIFNAKIHVLGVSSNEDEFNLNATKAYLNQSFDYFKSKNLDVISQLWTKKSEADLIMEYARTANCDMVVIMTDQADRSISSILGTQASKLVNHSNIPVLSVGPKKEFSKTDIPSI